MDFRDIKEFLKDTCKYIVVIVVAIVLVVYVVSLQQVVGPSMTPNYLEGNIFVLNKLQYRITNPKRFEVVVVKYDNSQNFIKRVIGLPGEVIEYRDNQLYVNGELVLEKFKIEGVTNDFSLQEIGYDVIPDDHYFVLGDNRSNSKDSREIGFIKKDAILGKVHFKIWPLF